MMGWLGKQARSTSVFASVLCVVCHGAGLGTGQGWLRLLPLSMWPWWVPALARPHSLACRRLAQCLLSVTRSSTQPSGQGTSSAQATRHSHLGQTQQHTVMTLPQTTYNLHWWHISDQSPGHRPRSVIRQVASRREASHVSLTPRRSWCEKTWQWFSIKFYWAHWQSVDCVGNKGNYLIHNRAVMRAWVGSGRAHLGWGWHFHYSRPRPLSHKNTSTFDTNIGKCECLTVLFYSENNADMWKKLTQNNSTVIGR